MDSTHISVTVILFLIRCIFCIPGDPVMYLPPFEVRTIGADNRQIVLPFANSQLQPVSQHLTPMQQQSILHTTSVQTTPPQTAPSEKLHESKNNNFTLNEVFEALNQLSENKEERHENSRAAVRDHDYPPYPASSPYPPSSPYPLSSPYPSSSPYPRPYGYSYPPRPSYGPWTPPYHEPAAYVPPTSVHHHAASKTLKPELSGLLKPVTTKVASKVSGLIGLVLTLLTGSSPDDLELKGFKDIVINGIVKPLLIAKGGIKSLISKLTIPVISLLLINLEVLITIWWLWEECPEPVHSPPAYPYPKPGYNNYNSYR